MLCTYIFYRYVTLPVEGVAVTLVIDGNKVHHEHIVPPRVESGQPHLERREHPSVGRPAVRGVGRVPVGGRKGEGGKEEKLE